MAINSLEGIIQRCHQRREKPLRQRKTATTPAMYTQISLHQYRVYCAHQYPVMLQDLEQAGISFMPMGCAPDHDQGPRSFGGDRFLKRQGIKDWSVRKWESSWGIQVYTGIPSERDGARWHDLHFKYEALCAAPDAVLACIEGLVNIVKDPLLTLGKSGGLRFSCRVQDYLHPNTEQSKLYIYKDTPTSENPDQRDVYLEIFGGKGHTRWDARYEILLGNLLEPPVIAKEVLFSAIDALRVKLHEPGLFKEKELVETPSTVPTSLGSRDLDLARKAFLRRGFSYVQQKNGYHHWKHPESAIGSTDVSLWERDGVVLVRASTADTGLPTRSTPIVEVWSDTGILAPISALRTSIPPEMIHVREEELSPLAIKRPPPVLDPENDTGKDEILERDVLQIQRFFDRDVRILGVISGKGPWNKQTEESFFLHGGAVCLNLPNPRYVAEAEKHFQGQDIPSIVHWKPRTHLWEAVKDIPVDVRMETPFQRGNVCEDPERCSALEEKGGNPNESVCPMCPVYEACQERGYLSQFTVLQSANVQILPPPKLFFDPQYTELAEEILKRADKTERLCIVTEAQAHKLFLECKLSKEILDEWVTNWQGCVLGNFAQTLLSALKIKSKLYADAVKGVRAVMRIFEWQEELLIQQMCQVNVRGRVVEREYTDPDSGKKLAHLTIEFEGGAFAYIPFNSGAAKRLEAKGMPIFRLPSIVVNEDIKIPMSMSQAIELGILDTETAESIQAFPTVCGNPNWTFWHQLKRFFSYYTRDADAPIRWDGEVLRFWVPPVLHASVKRLLVISSAFSEQHLHEVFPDEDLEIYRTEPTPWVAGNRVFQIRTGIYPSEAILDFQNWSGVGVSETGQRFLRGIHSEIVKDLGVKHGIITNRGIARRLEDIEKRRNVCFVDAFRKMRMSDSISEEADVIWIVGTPRLAKSEIWERAQILFGNDEESLSYEEETESGTYKDQRLQSILEEESVDLLTDIIVQAELDRLADRKVVLVTGLVLPNITHRPETSIFDWEDFEIADGLDKLPAVIATREHFEQEREKLTAESSRQEVQRILGCSERQANRILQRLRGGNIPRVPFRQQILSLLADGEKKTAEFTSLIDGHPEAIRHELARLVEAGEIIRVRRGMYSLPKAH